jgi:hypothetical protein
MPGDDRGNEGMRAPPFQPGNTYGGRPKGARNRLSHKFLQDLIADWEANGAAAIRIMRHEDPVAYCKLVGSLVPREVEITANTVAELDDAELDRMISSLRIQIAQKQELPMLPEPKVIEHVERE